MYIYYYSTPTSILSVFFLFTLFADALFFIPFVEFNLDGDLRVRFHAPSFGLAVHIKATNKSAKFICCGYFSLSLSLEHLPMEFEALRLYRKQIRYSLTVKEQTDDTQAAFSFFFLCVVACKIWNSNEENLRTCMKFSQYRHS